MEAANNKYVFIDQESMSTVFQNFQQMRQSQQLCDINLISNDNVLFHSHRVVLSGCSPFFLERFTNDEKKIYDKEMKLEWIDSGILSSIVNYMYTGELIITKTTVQDLFLASDKLQLPNVRQECVDFFKRQLNVNNCLTTQAFYNNTAGFSNNCGELFNLIHKFIEHHFTEIIDNDEFLNLPVNQLMSLLSNDHLNVHSETIVFNSLVAWIKHDLDNREKHFISLIKNIRLKLLTTEYIVRTFFGDPFLERQLHTDDGCFLSNLLKYKYELSTAHDWAPISSVPRQSIDLSYVLFVIGGLELKTVEFYDFDKKIWRRASDMLVSRHRARGLVFNGKLYVAGGMTTGSSLGRSVSSVEVYDGQTNEWTKLPDMLESRAAHGLVIFNNAIYALGGNSNTSTLDSFERFDFMTQKWSYLPTMLWKVYHFQSQILNNMLYVIGGQDDNAEYLNTVQVFNFKTQEWSVLPSMKEKRSNAVSCILNGKLYMCGGSPGTMLKTLPTVEYFDPETKSWTTIEYCYMEQPRECASAVVYNNFIYAIGGSVERKGNLSSIEIFNPVERKWRYAPFNLNTAVKGHITVLMCKSDLKALYGTE